MHAVHMVAVIGMKKKIETILGVLSSPIRSFSFLSIPISPIKFLLLVSVLFVDYRKSGMFGFKNLRAINFSVKKSSSASSSDEDFLTTKFLTTNFWNNKLNKACVPLNVDRRTSKRILYIRGHHIYKNR